MDTVKSFKGYGKVDDRDDADFRRKTRKRLIILSVSALLLIALIVGVVVGTIAHSKNNSDGAPATSAAIKSVCSVTRYPESCATSLRSSNSTDPQKIFQYSLAVAMDSLEKISNFPAEYVSRNNDLDERTKQALQVCSAVVIKDRAGDGSGKTCVWNKA